MVISAFLLALSPLRGQEAIGPLSLEDCRRMALEANSDFRNAELDSLTAADNVLAYKANYLPKFSLVGGWGWSDYKLEPSSLKSYVPAEISSLWSTLTGAATSLASSDAVSSLMAGLGIDMNSLLSRDYSFRVGSVYNATLMAMQPIYMGGKVTAAYKMALLGQEMYSTSMTRSKNEALTEVDEAYWTYLKTIELQDVADSYLETVEEFNRQMEVAYRNGMRTEADKMKVNLKVSEAKLQKRKAENGLRLARMNLCKRIGLPMDTPSLDVSSSLMPDDNALVNYDTLDISSRPEYDLLDKQVQLKEQQKKLIQADFLPQIAGIASYGYTHGMKFMDKNVIDRFVFMGGVTVKVPLFHWGEGARKVSAAQREVDKARNTRDNLGEMMRLELLKARNEYDEALLQVELMQESIAEADENLRVSRVRFDAGSETLGDYLEAQTVRQKAATDLVEAKANCRLAYTKYLKAAGKL